MKKLLSLLSAVAAMALVSCASAIAPVTDPIFSGVVTLPGGGTLTTTGSSNLKIATSGGAASIILQPGNGNIVPGGDNGEIFGSASLRFNAMYLGGGLLLGDGNVEVGVTGTGTAEGPMLIDASGGTLIMHNSAVYLPNTFNAFGVFYQGTGGAMQNTTVGTAGQVLTSNGAGNAPTFQAGGGGGGGISGATSGQIIVATGATTGTSYSGLTSDTSGNTHINSIQFPSGNISASGGNMVATGTWIFSSVLAPGGGILGEFSGGNAASGNIGQYMSAEVADTTTSLTTATQTNVFGTSTAALTLPSGDWDVGGTIYLVTTSATLTQITGTISTITASSSPTVGTIAIPFNLVSASNHMKFTLPTQRFSSNTSQAVYLNCAGFFSVGSMTAGGTVWARRSANAR